VNADKLNTFINKQNHSVWILSGIMIIAGILRYKINFEYNLIPGLNGGYYPVQVRSFLEDFQLGFPDFPLLFWIEAGIARLYELFGIFGKSHGIMIASKLTDTLFPVLSVVPVYLFIKEFGQEKSNIQFSYFIVAAFAVLYFAPVFLLTSDVQKNAMGNVWVFFVFLYSYRYISYFKLKDLGYLAIFIVLCFLTHITSAGLIILFLSIYIPLVIILSSKNRLTVLKGIGVLIILSILVLLWIRTSDPDRFNKMLSFVSEPLHVFGNPYLLYFIKGFPIMRGLTLVNFILINTFTLFCIILVIVNWRRFPRSERIFTIAVAFCALFATTPLLGYGWERLYMIAYIPITILLAIVLKTVQFKLTTRIITVLMVLTIGFSMYIPFAYKKTPSITEEAYKELQVLGQKMRFDHNSMVLAIHGLEWWTSWTLKSDIGQPASLSSKDFKKYDNIYYLYQLKGWNYFNSDQGRITFTELQRNYECLFFGTYFNLYKVTEDNLSSTIFKKLPNLSGKVVQVKDRDFSVRDLIGVQTVEADNNMIQVLRQANRDYENVMVNVWGKRKPFSMKIQADSIQHYIRIR